VLARLTLRLLLTGTAMAVLTATAYTAEKPADRRAVDPRVSRLQDYTLPSADDYRPESIEVTPAKGSLGRVSLFGSEEASPGVIIGDTWYDQQRNGSMGRMIGWGHDDYTGVHFTWMRLPERNAGLRVMQYQRYNATTGTLGPSVAVNPNWAGYGGMDVTGNNRAVVGSHERPDIISAPQFYWDADELAGDFSSFISRVPDSVMTYAQLWGREVIWPRFRYQETFPDTVLHVIAQVSAEGAGEPQAIYYFRKMGVDDGGEWDYPPYVIDTIYDLSQDLACSRTSGKVALAWTANLTGQPYCDTNSGEQPYSQFDNDLYYQISYDQGASWENRVNLTCNVDGEAGYRPYLDLSALIASDDNLHIVWSGRVWPANANFGGQIGYDCRLFHWSEDVPYIRTVHNAEWDQTTCSGGAWQMNVSKMTISECDGRFYVLWVQFNDIPGGIEDDCAARGLDGSDAGSSANGELWLSVSTDDGLSWDLGRNLTQTYTPGCDSATGAGGPCQSDHWPSMARFGTNLGTDWSGAEVIDPSETYGGDYYLDVQYINDHDPGSVTKDEGTWQLADVRWFRLACIDPVLYGVPWLSYHVLKYPGWIPVGVQADTAIVLENTGNTPVAYTVTVEEFSGPAGWLTYSGLSGTVPNGLDNTEEGVIHLNTGGIVEVNCGGYIVLTGRLKFDFSPPATSRTVEITAVVSFPYDHYWDTLIAGCFALAIDDGNIGMQGRGKVNLDYFNYGDCDTSESIPGNTKIYLYDGSPFVGWLDRNDTLAAYSIFSEGCWSENGLWSLNWDQTVSDMGDYAMSHSGILVNSDTSVALEQTIYAPQGEAECFMIRCLKVYSYSGAPVRGVSVGEVIDWDIPSDSATDNMCGYDAGRNLIYQTGVEYNQDLNECLNNSQRCGGMAFLEWFCKDYEWTTGICDTLYFYTALSTAYDGSVGELQSNIDDAAAWYGDHITTVTDANTTSGTDFAGGYVLDNPTWVYPQRGFDPQELYYNMNTMHSSEQYVCFDDSITDLHMVMTFMNDVELSGDGCCMGIRGNANNDPDDKVNISDVSFLLAYMFGTPSGPAPACLEEANANGDIDEKVNISDVTYLLAYLFGIPPGAPPSECP